ncbi:MAG: hypothetical protein KBC96_12985 [Armatimonadetes bacterium]|nr:hypothetical protein [Armatimonadota bacterium]
MCGVYPYVELVAAGTIGITVADSVLEHRWNKETSVAVLEDRTRSAQGVLGADSLVIGIHRTDEWYTPEGPGTRQPEIRVFVGNEAGRRACSLNDLLGTSEEHLGTRTVLLGLDGSTDSARGPDAHRLTTLNSSAWEVAAAIRGIPISLFLPGLLCLDAVDLLERLSPGRGCLFASAAADGRGSPARAAVSAIDALGITKGRPRTRSALLLVGLGGGITLQDLYDAADRLDTMGVAPMLAAWCEDSDPLSATACAYALKE